AGGEGVLALDVIPQILLHAPPSYGRQPSSVGFVTLNEVAPLSVILPPAAPPKATQYFVPPLIRSCTLAPVPGFGGTICTRGWGPDPSFPWIFTLSSNVPFADFESWTSLTGPLTPVLSTYRAPVLPRGFHGAGMMELCRGVAGLDRSVGPRVGDGPRSGASEELPRRRHDEALPGRRRAGRDDGEKCAV